MRPLAAAALVLAVLTAWAAPALTVESHGLERPASGARLTGPVDFQAFADASEGEQITAVRLRLLRAGAPYGELALGYREGPPTFGRSLWGSGYDPLGSGIGGGPLPNGAYGVEVAVSSSAATTGWTGHAVSFAVPPPTVSVEATTVEEVTGSVEVSWSGVTLPDFVRYDVQRALAGQGWATVGSIPSASTTSTVDVPPDEGEYRYRVVVVRGDGTGGETSSTSDPAGVDGAPVPMPNEPPPGRGEPTEEPTAQESPDAGLPTFPTDPSAPPAPPPPPPPPPSVVIPGRADPPALSLPPPAPVPQAAPPPSPFPTQTFAPTLPFPATQTEVAELGLDLLPGAAREGGTLAVYTEEPDRRRVVTAVAIALLCLVVAGHLRRLARPGT